MKPFNILCLNRLALTFSVFLSFFFFSPTNAKEETITLSSYQTRCHGPFPKLCYIQINQDGTKTFFYDEIEGFDFTPGYEYRLLVEVTPRCDLSKPLSCPMDIGLYEYQLKKQLSKKPSNASFEKDFPSAIPMPLDFDKEEVEKVEQEDKKKTNKAKKKLLKTYDMSMYPAPKKGFKRTVIFLDNRLDEQDYKVELIANKSTKVDCNTRSLLGRFEEKSVKGWGYAYYEFSGDGVIMSTKMLCPQDSATDGVASSQGIMINYRSGLPIVIYLKEDLYASYQEWAKVGLPKK